MQTCVVHLIRASMRFVSYTDRKKVAAALRPIYTAATADAAETALLEFAESALGQRHQAVVTTWQNAWERFIGVPGLPARRPQDHLHDERDRVSELPAPQDHQEPRALPE